MTPPDPGPKSLRKPFLGDQKSALQVAQRAAREVTAYARLLKDSGRLERVLAGGFSLADLPVIDKESYCAANAYTELMPAGAGADINGLFASSGSSGRSFCWPRAKNSRSSLSLPHWLEENFHIQSRPTLGVVALNMSGWLAGQNTALGLNQLALEAPYPFVVYCPGNDYERAVKTIGEVQGLFAQIVVFIYPVAIPYFLRLADDLGVALPMDKLRFATTGDPFAESFREQLERTCRTHWPETALASYCYSSTDTRVIGTETRASRALARLLQSDAGLRRDFGVGERLPNIYAPVPSDEIPLIEEVAGELVFTRWQAVPLVRYNLHDQGELWDGEEARRLVREASLPEGLSPIRNAFLDPAGAPAGLVAVYGRSRALYFYGLYLDEANLSRVMAHPKLAELTTGLFHASLRGDTDHPRLHWDIELKPGHAASAQLDAEVYRILVEGLIRIYPHFGVNYRDFLQRWDDDPKKRVFALAFHAYPALSRRLQSAPKHRSIAAQEAPPPGV